MGSYSRRLSRTQRRWSTRHQIDMAWLAAPGRPQRDVAIHGDDLCATSVITPCVPSANLRGTHSCARRGIHCPLPLILRLRASLPALDRLCMEPTGEVVSQIIAPVFL